MNTEFPRTLVEAILHFQNPKVAFDFMVKLRWPDGVQCPRCGCTHVTFLASRKIWQCNECQQKKQFSVRVGTIFEDSALALDKWLAALWMLANAKNGISSYEVHRAIGVTQKTAWFMLHRIRLAMQEGTIEKLSGEVEADETYVGGKMKNMHRHKQRQQGRGTGGLGKAIVMGLLQRQGRVKAKHILNAKRRSVQGEIRQHVEPGSQVFTDELRSYNGLERDFIHQAINHAICYARGNVHTNGLENFWSLLKRCIKGTYVSVDPAHLFRYLDEQVFRFNLREGNDASRFMQVVKSVIGRKMTYAELTGTRPERA